MRIALTCLFALEVTSSLATTLTVEDSTFEAAPIPVIAAITAHTRKPVTDGRGTECSFIAQPISLSTDSKKAADWLVTTKNACSWSASAAPIWIVRKTAKAQEVVLSEMTYSISLSNSEHMGLRIITSTRSTAAKQEVKHWKFNGTRYKVATHTN